MSSSDQESISRRSYPGHAETVSSCNANASTSSSPSVGPVKVVALATVVSTTSSTTTATTTALATGAPHPVPLSTNTTNGSSSNGNNNNTVNKKHNLGYRLRRLLFPQLRSTTGTTLSKHKTGKDVENNENQNFLKHSTSLYSNSSGDSEHPSSQHRSSSGSSKRRRANMRNQSQQTETLPEYPSLPPNTTASSTSPLSLQQQASLARYTPNAQGLIECAICLLEQAVSQYPELSTCNHRACLSCLRQYLRIEIFESRVNITCPECAEQLHPNDIKIILRNDLNLIDKYESFMVRRILITDPDARWCPAPDCDYCVIASGCASCPKLKCQRPGCETLFCYHCKQEWHSNQTCDQARAQRGGGRFGSQSKGGVTFSTRGDGSSQASGGEFLQRDDIKPCPCCKVLIIKMDDGSCNHMTCSVCGTEFCWLCMQKISDLHYLSPSGCTFWGKKPWSRKKKIMWQLGMLVGAPVGIALIAGIAVPAIIIGIPVWVGRKLYARFERNHLSRHKSNLLVTMGVLTSIFVSPILAAVAVGIGVPILLAYVYGVVPISLCRSGGCGVTTSSSGVRIELDEDEISANVAPDGVSVDTALSGHRGIANPSIGEVSLGMSTSLSIGSSSHLDRVILDIQPDRESSSIAACAGSITSNLLMNNNNNASGGHGGGSRGSGHTMSVHSSKTLDTAADVISNKRFSFSSANADATSVTLSFGDRSINTNISESADGASLKVHTGSIKCDALTSSQHNQPNPNCSLSPVEVHVNICATEEGEKDKATQTAKEQQVRNSTNIDSIASTSAHTQQPCSAVLGKYESRSLEYLASNYCRYCHKSHKPICPNLSVNATIPVVPPVMRVQPQVVTGHSTGEELAEQIKNGNPSTADADIADENISSGDTLKNANEQPQNRRILQAKRRSADLEKNCDSEKAVEPSTSTSSTFISCMADSQPAVHGSTLTKKAMSQIFFPSSHFSSFHSGDQLVSTTGDDHHLVNSSNSPKSALSHSLSFTINNSRHQ